MGAKSRVAIEAKIETASDSIALIRLEDRQNEEQVLISSEQSSNRKYKVRYFLESLIVMLPKSMKETNDTYFETLAQLLSSKLEGLELISNGTIEIEEYMERLCQRNSIQCKELTVGVISDTRSEEAISRLVRPEVIKKLIDVCARVQRVNFRVPFLENEILEVLQETKVKRIHYGNLEYSYSDLNDI